MIPPPGCPTTYGGGERSTRKETQAYVYLLKSLTTGRCYLGWTTELECRIAEHARGASRFTKSRGPWQLVGYERYGSPAEAKQRERLLKRNARMRALFQKRLSNRALTARPAFGGPSQVGG